MASHLHHSLKSALTNLVASLPAERSSLGSTAISASFPHDTLRTRLAEVWTGCIAGTNEQQDAQSSTAAGRRVDMLRSTMDLVGREIVVLPIVSGELAEPDQDASREDKDHFLTAVQDRLDVILTLYEVVHDATPNAPSLEPGAIFIPLLEDLVELISVETWRDLWGYVESRSKRFTKDMPASKGKALPLLRTINAFLRFLPRTPADLVFRGRVHQFASSVISVADKSAINMRGDYSDIRTTWDPEDPPSSPAPAKDEEVEGDGDVKMQEGEGGGEGSASPSKKPSSTEEEKPTKEKEEAAPKKPAAMDFYPTLWSLQQYFSNPPSLDGTAAADGGGDGTKKTSFAVFREKTDFVLPRLFEETKREREMMGKEVLGGGGGGSGKKRKREGDAGGEGGGGGGEEGGGFFHPRYLTGKKLLDHELADTSFRRQILVQYFILFQFLLNLTPASASKQAFTGGMPKTFVIAAEDEAWVKGKVSAIREELRKMLPDGTRFEETVLSIITRERHYAQWKNDGCPESVFEVPPLDTSTAKEAAAAWKKRMAPPAAYPFKVGSRSLSKLWNRGFTDISQLKRWKRTSTMEGLDEEVQRIEMDEEDDKAMGQEPEPDQAAENAERKTNLNWRALRLASHTHLREFGALAKKREIRVLRKAIDEAAARQPKRVAEIKGGKEAQVGGGEGGGDGGDAEGDKTDGEEDVEGLKGKEGEGGGEGEGHKAVGEEVVEGKGDKEGQVGAVESAEMMAVTGSSAEKGQGDEVEGGDVKMEAEVERTTESGGEALEESNESAVKSAEDTTEGEAKAVEDSAQSEAKVEERPTAGDGAVVREGSTVDETKPDVEMAS